MERSIYIFTHTFPYGKGEQFLNNEILFLANEFEKLIIVPLQPDINRREVPPNTEVLKPILPIDTKENPIKFIVKGIFNFSPFFFACNEWKNKQPWKSSVKTREFLTFLLRFRVAYKNLQINPKAHDVVYFYWGDKSVMLAPVIKKKFRCKIAVRFHGSDLYEEAKIGYIPFRQYVLPAIDQLITVSDFGHRYILNEYKSQVSDSKILVSRLGVFDHGVNASQSANPGFFHMVSCSNLVELKRINLIIKALSLISFRVKWTHFGDGPLREELHSLCETLPPNIEANWMGHQSNELVISYYKENYIDLFINVSSSEGIPVSIMEAMSFGIPAMATNVGGVSELVNASNGILLQAGLDENMLANSIISFVKNENKIGLRENAREHWKQNFNAVINYQELVTKLKHL